MGSIVVAVDLEEAPGVQAGGADLRSGGAHNDMTAVAALPYLYFALFKDLGGLHIAQQGTVAFLMALFDGSYQTELGSQFREALCFGGSGKAVVHIGPLVVFPFSGME